MSFAHVSCDSRTIQSRTSLVNYVLWWTISSYFSQEIQLTSLSHLIPFWVFHCQIVTDWYYSRFATFWTGFDFLFIFVVPFTRWLLGRTTAFTMYFFFYINFNRRYRFRHVNHIWNCRIRRYEIMITPTRYHLEIN